MEYRLYTIGKDGAASNVAIPESRVENFDEIISNLPEGYDIEEILNRFEAIHLG